MKKIVGIMAAAALATSAFALDLSAGVNSKIVWGTDGYGWAEDHIGTDDMIGISASADVAGANINIRAQEGNRGTAADKGVTDASGTAYNDKDGNAVIVGSGNTRALFVDAYNVWVKPVSVLKLTMGTGADFSIFGDGIGKGDGKIGIINDGQGVKAELTPIENLWIGARVGAPANKFKEDLGEQLKFEVGASYAIDGVAKFGAEFAREGENDGSKATPKYKFNAFMVGAEITAVENMNFKVDFAGIFGNPDVLDMSAYKIGAFATMKFDALTIKASDRIILRTGTLGANESFSNIACAEVSVDVNAFRPYVGAGFATNISTDDDTYKAKQNGIENGAEATKIEATAGCDYKVGAATVTAEYTYKYSKLGSADATTSWELPVKFKYAF